MGELQLWPGCRLRRKTGLLASIQLRGPPGVPMQRRDGAPSNSPGDRAYPSPNDQPTGGFESRGFSSPIRPSPARGRPRQRNGSRPCEKTILFRKAIDVEGSRLVVQIISLSFRARKLGRVHIRQRLSDLQRVPGKQNSKRP